MGKNPAFLFYPADWLKDPELALCSFAAKGLWITILCRLWECPTRGVFAFQNGNSWSNEDIARACGLAVTECDTLLAELEMKGVARRNESGALFSNRMVKDEKQRVYATDRKRKERLSRPCHTNVTHLVTPLSVTETVTVTEAEKGTINQELPAVLKVDENTLVVAPGGVDSCVEEIQAAWKKPMGYLGMKACLEAFDFEAKKKHMEFLQAAKYVRDKTLIISALMAEWPPGEQKFIPKLTDFMDGQQYENEFATWERNGDGGKKSMLTF